ncbi:MAG: PorT family protein [Clostridiales bacterium]|nr:PorT family protein [Clostridiales bacterium]
MKYTLPIILTLLLTALHLPVQAQEESYRFDLGAGLGMGGYLGDLNESNPFARPGFTGELSFRYRFDTRWALATRLGYSSLSGNSDDLEGVLPDAAHYEFKSNVIDLSERVEVNFFAFGIGETYKKLKRWSPYLSVGIGLAMASCDGASHMAFTIPMAVGVKYKLKQRINLGLEFSMTKAFGDHLDGELSDLYQIKSSMVKNTDWYSRLALSISYEFGLRCPTCHYYD